MPNVEPWVYVRFAADPAGGRLVPVELYIDGGPLTGSILRRLPIGKLEAWVNEPDARAKITDLLDSPRPLLDVAITYMFKMKTSGDHWAVEMLASQEPDSEFLPAPKAGLPEKTTAVTVEVDAALDVPEGRVHPDTFYKAVAEVHRDVLPLGKPVKTIAEANEVAVTRAQGWVREARSRGYLPKAEWGKAG